MHKSQNRTTHEAKAFVQKLRAEKEERLKVNKDQTQQKDL